MELDAVCAQKAVQRRGHGQLEEVVCAHANARLVFSHNDVAPHGKLIAVLDRVGKVLRFKGEIALRDDDEERAAERGLLAQVLQVRNHHVVLRVGGARAAVVRADNLGENVRRRGYGKRR